MVSYLKFTCGSQFSGEKKQFVNPLHGVKVTTIPLIQENSCVVFKHTVEVKVEVLVRIGDDIRAEVRSTACPGGLWWMGGWIKRN